jgi:hypothetical protein
MSMLRSPLRPDRARVWLAAAAAVIMISGPKAEARKVAGVRPTASSTPAALPQKPLKLRYFGGPKSPIYPE